MTWGVAARSWAASQGQINPTCLRLSTSRAGIARAARARSVAHCPIAVAVSDSSPSSTASEKTAVAGSSPKGEAKNDAAPVEQKTQRPTETAAEPAPENPAEYPNGDYVVGEDIPAGTYQTAGAEKGIFEFCSVTTDPVDEAKFPQLKSANADERIIITLTKADGVVSISGCEPLTRR
jgi:hypothetical protein